MSSNHVSVLVLSVVLLVGVGFSGEVRAAPIPACVAGDIVAGDPSCPVSGACTITQIFTISDGCVLDFGARDVTISQSGELRIDTASVTFKVGDFIVAGGGLVDGETNTVGGSFTVEATGDIAVQATTKPGKIRVSGKTQGGSLLLQAGGDITIDGQTHAHNRTEGEAAGGDITLRAGGNVVLSASADVDPHGGDLAFGGFLDVVAGGLIDIGSPIDNTGGDGGTLSFTAGGKIVIRDDLDATGQGDAGSGGDIDIFAGTDVEIDGRIQSRGTGSAVGSGGGDGGAVVIGADFGDIIVREEINVQSGTPDGFGGDLELFAQGSIDVQPTGYLIANGNGFESDGGGVLLSAGIDITLDGLVEAEGGDGGGEIEIEAGRDIAINALVRARSTNSGSLGGSVAVQAGLLTSGNVVLTNTIDASAPGCDALFGFCSLGGDVDISGCDVTVQSIGVLRVDAPGSEGNGGAIFVAARDQMTISGSLDATGAGGPLDGSNTFVYPNGVPPIVTGSVAPAPINMPREMCTGGPGDSSLCLTPCPTCGNGVTEFPEACDDTTGTPESCDGCSVFCQLEDCDDQKLCTFDSCDPSFGCRHDFVARGTLCRAATGPCDFAETCTGVSSACPADAFKPGTTVCRASTDTCDSAETCTGSDPDCPGDVLEPAGAVCRPAGGSCDPEETCTGASAACPADVLESPGTVCRPVSGSCDLEEICTGASAACPADTFEPSTVLCRGSAGPCDEEESCTGSGPSCPPDAFTPSTTVCFASAGTCDPAETCTGTGPLCPGDVLEPASTVCRASAGPCDRPENCTGSSPACPGDVLEPAGTVCRSDVGDCDVEEVCSGSLPTCPADGFEPAGTSCDDEEVCTIDDICDGDGSCIGDPMTCGDGMIQGACGEECDDGDADDGDGCSGTCAIELCYACSGEPSGCSTDLGAPCDDGDLCTNGDTCSVSATCVGEERPRTGCRTSVQSRKAKLLIKDREPDKGDLVLFTWIKGAETGKAEFGRPTFDTDYAFCLYDESGDAPSLILQLRAPTGTLCKNSRSCWKENKKGFNYIDGNGSRDGLQKLQLKAGGLGKAKAQVKARGENLPLPALPLDQDSTVTAQLVGGNGLCFEAQFSSPPKRNRSDLFKDTGD